MIILRSYFWEPIIIYAAERIAVRFGKEGSDWYRRWAYWYSFYRFCQQG